MTLYSIYERPDPESGFDRIPEAVPEKFSWFAAFLPPLYALAHGMWLTLLFWIALVGGLVYAAPSIGESAAIGIYVLVALFIGFEAPALRREQLSFRGYLYRGEIIAAGEDLAQHEYLSLK
jgi:hypothetical protein